VRSLDLRAARDAYDLLAGKGARGDEHVSWSSITMPWNELDYPRSMDYAPRQRDDGQRLVGMAKRADSGDTEATLTASRPLFAPGIDIPSHARV
jgi:hypothetical protein